jgi:FtsP/CotA-like multicopper oxidase with cupredoxin domain
MRSETGLNRYRERLGEIVSICALASATASQAQAPQTAPTAGVDASQARTALSASSVASKHPVVARNVEIAKGRASVPDDTLRFRQGDAVEITVTSDAPMDLHLHGYDIEASVRPGRPARFTFVAKLPGRFPISEHRQDARHHHSVLFIEVHP